MPAFGNPPKYLSSAHVDESTLSAQREFTGAGPMINWDASQPLLGNAETGHLQLDWNIGAGILFGKQKTTVSGTESSGYFYGEYRYTNPRYPLDPLNVTPVDVHRSKSVSVPVVDLSLGLSYDIQRIKLSAGYRWERYFNVLDAGDAEHKDYDRTIDGPYFKIAVGFGG